VITNNAYRGGPFVIDTSSRAVANPIVSAWVTANATTVHVMKSFTAPIARTLTAAPKIGVFVDGFEDIAFRYLNAAKIPDSTGQAWPAAIQGNYNTFPDVLTDPQI